MCVFFSPFCLLLQEFCVHYFLFQIFILKSFKHRRAERIILPYTIFQRYLYGLWCPEWSWNQSLRDNHTTYTKHPERTIINILPPFFYELYLSMHINTWCLCECPCTHASTLGFGPTICKKIAGTHTRHPYNFRKYFLQITRFLHIISMSLSQKIGKNSLCLLIAISYSNSPKSPQKSFRAVPTPIRHQPMPG